MLAQYQIDSRYGIERAILATLIMPDLGLDTDHDKCLSHHLDFSIFKSNITTKAVAKALHNLQEDGTPIDEEIIAHYIEKFMPLDRSEYIAILSSKTIPYSVLVKYEQILRELDKQEETGVNYARV